MEENSREAALAFLRENKLGVVTTLSKEGTPRARLVYYATNEDFSIFFVTLKNTRKADDIASHHQGAFVVATDEIPKTIQLEGILADVTEQAQIDEVLVSLTDHLLSNTIYGAPLLRFDQDKLMYYRLTPTWIRFGKFTEGHSSDEVFKNVEV